MTRGKRKQPWEIELADLDELDLIGDHHFTLGVPEDSSENFRKYVFAAAKTVMMGNRSVDHVLRSYGDHWTLRDTPAPSLALVRAMNRMTKHQVREAATRLEDLDAPGGAPPGLVAAQGALLRLQASFRGAILMCRLGLRFEAAVIARLILEQIAWACAVHGFRDLSFWDILPTKSVSSLRRIWPDVGRLYGQLTEVAHIVPEVTAEYLLFSGNGPAVVIASVDDTRIVSFQLLYLSYVFSVTSVVTMRSVVHGESLNEAQALAGAHNATVEAHIGAFRTQLVEVLGAERRKRSGDMNGRGDR
jgi:hypothetical protein